MEKSVLGESGNDAPRVLIVDDEPSILRMLTRAMAHFGWETDAFPSAEHAAAEFIPGKYDMALCDVDLLHGSDGFALAQQLKVRDSGLRVVMMSGDPSNAERARAMGLQLLAKPFRFEEIPFLKRPDRISGGKSLANSPRD